jgi:hypothetical protein
MQTIYATRQASDAAPNDDYVIASETFAVVLDGATAPAGLDSGCIHAVPWLVAQLGTHLTRLLATEPGMHLREILRAGIELTCAAHADTCDLTNRNSPSSTAAMLRLRDGQLEYAVLGDTGLVTEYIDGSVVPTIDKRVDFLPDYTRETVAALRNTDEGFWVASTRPEAADWALCGAAPAETVRRAALLTDGVGRLAEHYGWTWQRVMDRLAEDGPAAVIAEVRRKDARIPKGTYRGKWPHDDCTAVLIDLADWSV